MSHLTRLRSLGVALISSALLIPLIQTPTSAHSEEPAPPPAAQTVGITNVVIRDSEVDVVGTTGGSGGGASIDIHALGPEQQAGIGDAGPVVSVVPDADGNFTARLPRFDDDGTDRLYGQFTAVAGGDVLGVPQFAHSLDFSSGNERDYPVAINKKGVQVTLTDDAEELGVQHAGINVDLADIMLREKLDAADTVEFVSDGKTYYFSRSAITALDTQIKPLSDNGALVNLIILLYRHPDDPNSAADLLIHPDAVDAPGAGPVYGFNTVTPQGVAYLTAAMEFVASRYSRTDEKYGLTSGYIVGNEVDSQWTWSNSGDKTLVEFMDTYSRALRLMSQASRKYFGESRTYISLTHFWTGMNAGNPDPNLPTRYYPVRDLVDEMSRISKTSGDFPWFVAYHPYPQDLFQPAFWNDTEATDSIDTKQITFKNLQILPQYLDQERLRHDGEPRRIILSEQGCNTPGNGDSLTEEAEKAQAACYAYAYYKIRFLPSIDSFILHRHVDHRQEGGLNLGLWAADYSVKHPNAPLRHKYIYDVFKYIDTERSLEVTDFAKDIIGIDDWADVIEGFDPAALNQRPVPLEAATRVGGQSRDERVIGNFTSGTDGWMPSDNAASAVSAADVLHVATAPDTFAKQWRGVVKDFDTPLALNGASWLTAKIRIPSDAELGAETQVRVKVTLEDRSEVYGTARVPADGAFHTVAVTLDTAPADAKVTRMKIWLRGQGNTQPTPQLDVGAVALSSNATRSRLSNVAATAATSRHTVVGSTLTLTLTNLDVDALKGRISFPECGDYRVSPSRDSITPTAFNETATLTVTVESVTSKTPANLCVRINGADLLVPVTIPPPMEQTVFGFEKDVEGWQPGEHVTQVEQVTTFLNGPRAPRSGTGALEATTDIAPASDTKSVFVDLDTPLDLSAAKMMYAWVDSYGGAPGAKGYTARLILTSADGTSVHRAQIRFKPDQWNRVEVEIGDWPGRSSVSRIEVSFRAQSSTVDWSPKFQVDDVGYFE